jgi:hypothetical protein
MPTAGGYAMKTDGFPGWTTTTTDDPAVAAEPDHAAEGGPRDDFEDYEGPPPGIGERQRVQTITTVTYREELHLRTEDIRRLLGLSPSSRFELAVVDVDHGIPAAVKDGDTLVARWITGTSKEVAERES